MRPLALFNKLLLLIKKKKGLRLVCAPKKGDVYIISSTKSLSFVSIYDIAQETSFSISIIYGYISLKRNEKSKFYMLF
jgi:hypothetical protein